MCKKKKSWKTKLTVTVLWHVNTMYPFVPNAAWSAAEATIISYCNCDIENFLYNCDYKSWFCTIIHDNAFIYVYTD